MRRVLVVDDEEDVEALFLQRFRKELRAGAVALTFARSGEQALAHFDGKSPDFVLILSDINMPGMSGFELLHAIKALRPSLPVVMVSAYGDADHQARAASLGAEGFVAKPIDFDALRPLVPADRRRRGRPWRQPGKFSLDGRAANTFCHETTPAVWASAEDGPPEPGFRQ